MRVGVGGEWEGEERGGNFEIQDVMVIYMHGTVTVMAMAVKIRSVLSLKRWQNLESRSQKWEETVFPPDRKMQLVPSAAARGVV
jgi:hypothetical protein